MDDDDPFVDPALARLLAYQEAVALSAFVRQIVRAWRDERRLRDQITSAADSVYANVAEGHGHRSRAEKRRYFATRGRRTRSYAATQTPHAKAVC